MSCGYQGYEFGAHYPDSLCCDGYLWDADSGDEMGMDNGGDIPCPVCNRKQWMAFYRNEIIECGMEQADRKRGPKTVKYGGFPEPIRGDAKAMRTIRRWLRRGWYQGKKFDAEAYMEAKMTERGMIFTLRWCVPFSTTGRRRPGGLSNGNRLGSLKLVSAKTVANGRGAKMLSMLATSGTHARSAPSATASGCVRLIVSRHR